jgi:probable F420-dependent oxidoreductase
MKVDVKLPGADGGLRTPSALAELARDAERRGYAGLWSTESAHDAFLPLPLVAQASSTLEIGTAIAVAFSRNPMTMAYAAHDLQLMGEGRFHLGLGSQVKPHIERRFGMEWSRPAARMREFIQALRAIWDAWNRGEPLDFRGEHYSHTLMTPFFSPEPSPWGAPAVYLAAVGEQMTEVAGAVCDGLLPHPFTTERYLRECTLPTVRRGRGRALGGFSISLQGLVVCGRTEEEMAVAARGVRDQIAFYASTPSYSPVLELHGWAELGTELNRLSRTDDPERWRRMGDLVDDEVLTTFAVVAEPDRLGPAIRERFGDVVDRFTFYAPYEHDPGLWQPAIDDLSRAGDR